MLLGHFLNSGQTDTLADAKSAIKSPIPDINQTVSPSSDEFKKALNNSITVRSKSFNNQMDKVHSESGLLSNVKLWNETIAENELPQEVIELKQADTQRENLVTSSEFEPIIDLATQHEITNGEPNGEIMPIDGKQLPTELASHLVTAKEAISEQGNKFDKKTNAMVSDTTKSGKIQLSPELNNQTEKSKISAHFMSGKVISDKTIETTDPKAVSAVKLDVTKQKQISDLPTTQPIDTKTQVQNSSKISFNSQKEVALPIDKDITAHVLGKTVQSTVKQEKIQQFQAAVNNTNYPSKATNNDLNLKSIVEDELNQKQNKAINKDLTHVSGKTAESVAPLLTDKNATDKNATDKNAADKNATDKNSANKNVVVRNAVSLPKNIELNVESKATINESATNLRTALLTGKVKLQTVADDVSARLNTTATSESNATTVNKPTSVAINEINPQTQPQNSLSNQAVNKSNDAALSVSVPNKHWNQKFAEHVSMLALKGASSAHIKLDPPELGPMAVRIHHTGTETQVQFQVSNPIARELVDSGMQRLREMLEQHGFENVDVDVSEQSDSEQYASGEISTDGESDENIDDINTLANPMTEKYQTKSLVDIFA